MPTIFFKHLQLYCTLCQHLEFENILLQYYFDVDSIFVQSIMRCRLVKYERVL